MKPSVTDDMLLPWWMLEQQEKVTQLLPVSQGMLQFTAKIDKDWWLDGAKIPSST
ncbi:MAG: hypothetical protein WCI66_05340 [Gammaproteobacteria bacterium]|jgi:hypothetical protein